MEDLHNYVSGEWRPSASRERIVVHNPATLEQLATVPVGDPSDVDSAVSAAQAAFDTWSTTDVEDRVLVLKGMEQLLKERADAIAEVIIDDLGAPTKIAQRVHVGLSLAVVSDIIARVGQPAEREMIGNSLIVREAYGVIGAITPWNYPLYQAVAKLIPAIAAGCTVVLKPSEIAPLAAYEFATIAHDAGLPAGVFNLVSGSGPIVGEALAGHQGIDLVSFTGSGTAGRRVAALAGQALHKVTLELGGKSANILLEDADLSRAVPAALADAYLNSGQTCRACTRLLVPRSRIGEVVDRLQTEIVKWAIGDPRDAQTRLGPLVSNQQLQRVSGFVDRALSDGATILAGDRDIPQGLGRGHFISPLVLGASRPEMEVIQQEIFGPVLTVQVYDNESEAVQLANGTAYGLAGSVWSADEQHALDVAQLLRTGQVDINGGRFNAAAPFGGVKESGFGRELGTYGIEEFQSIKAIQL